MAASLGCVLYADSETQTPENPEIIEDYAFTQSVYAGLSISSRKATCVSRVVGNPSSVTKIEVVQTLQKKSGTSWVDVESWSNTYYSSNCTFTNTKSNLPSGGTYCVETYAKVYINASVYEPVTAYSTEVIS